MTISNISEIPNISEVSFAFIVNCIYYEKIFTRIIGKYFLQIVLGTNRNDANLNQHIKGICKAFSKVSISVIADVYTGIFPMILFLYPCNVCVLLLDLSLLFLDIQKKSVRMGYFVTSYISSILGSSLSNIFFSYAKIQFPIESQYNKFMNSWYYQFNMLGFTTALIAPSLFLKVNEGKKLSIFQNTLFFILPLIFSTFFFIIFVLNKKKYIKENFRKISFKQYFSGIFRGGEGLSKEENIERMRKIRYILWLCLLVIFYSIIDDQFHTCIVDFADSSNRKVNFFGIKFKMNGEQITMFNPLTVFILSPIFNYYVFPILKNKFSKSFIMSIAVFLNQTSILSAGLIHFFNSKKDISDKSGAPSILLFAIPVILNAIAEFIIIPIFLCDIAEYSPEGYKSFFITLSRSTDGISNVYCVIINRLPIDELKKLLIFGLTSIICYFCLLRANKNK